MLYLLYSWKKNCLFYIVCKIFRTYNTDCWHNPPNSFKAPVLDEMWRMRVTVWQEEIFHTNSSSVPFHVLTVTKISIPVMSACTVTGAGCHCCQIVSSPNFAVQTSLQFSPQLGQLFPDPCLSLTVLTQSQNNPENPLISQDIDIIWHKQTY